MTNPNPPNTLDEPNEELKQALTAALLSLADMYDQYCGDNYGHAFMGAGEGAIEILENYGLADEVHGVDWEAYEAFEAKHKVTDKQPSPTKPDINQQESMNLAKKYLADGHMDAFVDLVQNNLWNDSAVQLIEELITNKQLEARVDALENILESDAWGNPELLKALIKAVIKGNTDRISELTKKVAKE